MKHVSITLLIVMVGLTSCAVNQEKQIPEETKSSFFQPEPLDDKWNKWLVGEWEGGFKIEFGLNGQFLIMRGSSGEMTDEQKKQIKEALKETTNASDEDMERFLSMPYKFAGNSNNRS